MIREAIAKLVEEQALTREEARDTMRSIMAGEATPSQIGAYITALRIRGETPDVIAGSAEAMRENFTPIKTASDIVVDTCGTGGDGTHTFNISTAASFVAAGAGATVAKHGNRSVSSKCGSADVLEALGVDVTITPEAMTECLESVGIAFLFAPSLHPAMKHAIGPRKEIGIRSIFNILGPLSNPAGAQYGVLGVYDRDVAKMMAEAAANLGAKHLFVVHGEDGLDEITTTTTTHIAEVIDGTVKTYELSPEEVGLPISTPEDLKGGDAKQNAQIVSDILSGEAGPKRDIVVLNAAAAIAAAGLAEDIKSAVPLAQQSIDSGNASGKLKTMAERTQAATSGK